MPLRRLSSLFPRKKTPRRGSEEFPTEEQLAAAAEAEKEEKIQIEEAQSKEVETELNPPGIQGMVDRLIAVKNEPDGTSVYLSEEEMTGLCHMARPILLGQPVLLELAAPMKICGDIHGQFRDLLHMLESVGYPPANNFLFLGDYVDRGLNSIETICLLLAFKVLYPENFFLLRGNHECETVSRIYGFYDECKRRYSVKLYRTFCSVFDCLPVAALLEERVLCMHGGLSPDIRTLADILDIERPCPVPEYGIMCDLLWSDPNLEGEGWGDNERGVSWIFGADVVEQFLEAHDLDLIVRGHQVVEDGYEFFANRQLVTLFSAPNYCGEFDNAGAMIIADEDLTLSFQVFGSCQEALDEIAGRQNESDATEASSEEVSASTPTETVTK